MKEIILIILITLSFNSFSDGKTEQGWFLKAAHLIATDEYDKYDPNPAYLQDYIATKNTKNSINQNIQIADAIISISKCFKVDPLLVTSIIEKESIFFPNAVSPTKAQGIMQLTTIASTEVKDQLGYRGSKYAQAQVTEIFKTNISMCSDLSMSEFDKLFSASTHKRREILRTNVKLNIAVGVITFKVLLAQAYSKIRNSGERAVIRRAVENYNGDTHKVSYANKVLSHFDLHIKKHY